MKKIVLSLAAIAALSTAAFADRDDIDHNGLNSKWFASTSKVVLETAPLASEDGVLSAYDRMIKLATERQQGNR